MNLFKKITTGALALTLSVGLVGSAFAATGDVAVEVIPIANNGNVLTVAISQLTDLGDYQYSLTDQPTSPGLLKIDAADYRGTADGWKVTLSGTDFIPVLFTVDNLGLTAGTVRTISTSALPSEAAPVSSSAADVMLAPGSTVLTAPTGTGAGIYQADYQVDLNIPGGTLVGQYTSTLTVTISGNTP